MAANRHGRKNKNAFAQNNRPAAHCGTPVGTGRAGADGETATMDEQSHISQQDRTTLPDGLHNERSRTVTDSGSSIDLSATSETSANNVPTRYLETTATLADLVLDEGLVVKDVISDGNCLFSAVVDQLRVRGEFFYTTASLREVAVNYLRDNPCQEDGTPLKMFLTDQDGTWEQYLSRMSREGEWGDHFVISALANVLQRKLVILSGFNRLTRTVAEPTKPHTSRGPGGSGSPGTQQIAVGSEDQGETCVEAGAEERRDEMSGPDELYLGHIAEAHYVSLRHYDWEDRLHKSMSRV